MSKNAIIVILSIFSLLSFIFSIMQHANAVEAEQRAIQNLVLAQQNMRTSIQYKLQLDSCQLINNRKMDTSQ